MSMMSREIKQVIEQSSQRLLKIAVPPVKFWTLSYVLAKGPENREVQKAVEEARHYAPRVRLLSTQREDGTWPISREMKEQEEKGLGPPYGWTHTTMVRNLDRLYDYCADPDEGHINASIDKILSWQDEEGFIRGPAQDMIPRPYSNGITLSIIRGLGRKQSEPGLKRISDWLYRIQRHDSGWNIPYLQDMRYSPEFRSMRLVDFKGRFREGKVPEYRPEMYGDVPSCYWTTQGVLRGLSWMPDDERIRHARHGGEFLLNGFFKKNYHPGFYKSEATWKTLKFPTYYGSGLMALLTLICLGFDDQDARMEAPIKWLLSARKKDGFWYNADRPHELNDQWITVNALAVLAMYAKDSECRAMLTSESGMHPFRSQ